MLLLSKGDFGAFETLIERYKKRIINFAARYLGESSEAEDVAQEVFIKVFKARSSYSPTARFSSWIYTIALNVCRNWKRQKRSPSLPPEKIPSYRENLSSLWAIKEAIDSLPEREKLALILAKFEGLSILEISEVMQVSPQAVKSLLWRARERLKKMLF